VMSFMIAWVPRVSVSVLSLRGICASVLRCWQATW
jgi:hypothetical protein